jgi:ParB-like chromosome segregation protein Spo0J
VKPSLIKWPELRVTATFDEETRQLLRSSIKEAGILAPVLVQEIEGELVGVDGKHRTEDAIAMGDSPIDVAVLEGDMADLLCRNLFLDHVRGKTPVSGMAKVIRELYTTYQFDSDKIKAKTGLPRDYIEKLIKISGASPEVLQYVDEQWMGISKAYEICRLPYRIQQEELIIKLQAWKWPLKEVKEMVDAALGQMKANAEAGTPTVVTAPRPIARYHCEGCKAEADLRYLRSVMLCPNCFGEVWRLSKVFPTQGAEPLANGVGD